MRNPSHPIRHWQRRRQLLKAFAFVPFATLPGLLQAKSPARTLRFSHLHTEEALTVTYFENGAYLPDALAEIDFLLRDFRTGEVHPIEPALLDLAHQLQAAAGSHGTFEIFSGYRSPATNEMLRQTSHGVARHSYHMQGQALDLRLTDVPTGTLRQMATRFGMGGVGYYPEADFLHVDVGPVRAW